MNKTFNTFLKPLNISKTKAGIVISSVGCFILAINIMFPFRWFEETNLDTIINFAACIALVVCNFDGNIYINKRKMIILCANIVLGGLMIFQGIKFSVLGYISFGAFYIVIVPLLLIIIKNSEHIRRLMISASVGVVAASALLFIASMIFTPLSYEQYSSITGNPNALGMYAAWGFCGAWYLSKQGNGKLEILFYFFQGINLGLIIFSRSRTALLVVIGAMLVFAICYLIEIGVKKTFFKFIKFFVITFAAVLVAYLGLTYGYSAIGVSQDSQIAKTFENKFNISYEEINESEFISFDEVMSASGKRSLKGINDDNSFSSGRIIIWKTFIDEIGFSGHKSGLLDVNGIKNYNAHNAYLQISYSFGLVTGSVYLLLTLYYGLIILKNFIKCVRNKTFENEFIFSTIVLIGYLISSMLSAAVSPYLYYFVFMMNICIVPYIGQNYIYKFKEGTNGV